jgi:hypothetical protein
VSARRRAVGAGALALLLGACGGGSGGAPADGTVQPANVTSAPAAQATGGSAALPSGPNVLAITVDHGPSGTAYINSPFVSVTLCQPGTTTCQQIDHVLLDTGSAGLRVRGSALAPALALPAVMGEGGTAVAQCMQFASGYTWGSVRRADVLLADERAAGVGVQVIDDTASPYGAPPSACTRTGPSVAAMLDANGILGVGTQRLDCGPACAASAQPGVYFACNGGGCLATALPTASQVGNPVAALARRNNGVAVTLPAVPAGGSAAVVGALVLGVGTDDNNQLAGARAVPVDGRGLATTTYAGATLDAFIDSGTNALFFPDTALPRCGSFYCPAAPVTLSARLAGAGGAAARDVDFTVDAVGTLRGDAAAASLGGPSVRTFQWGLPFFFGRTVFIGVADAESPAGTGPFWAF